MTTTDTRQLPPFGVGAVLTETLRIFARRFGLLFLLAFVPLAVVYGVTLAMVPGIATGQPAGTATYDPLVLAIVAMLVFLLGYSVLASLIILAAFDDKLGRPVSLNAYVKRAILSIPPVFILSFVAVLLAALASGVPFVVLSLLGDDFVAFVLVTIASAIPGFYVWSMFSALVPAIVIEGAGFKALGRSMTLTAGYRWPVFATLLIFIVANSALNIVARLIVPLALGIGGIGGWLLVMVAIISIGAAAIAVSVAMIYVRLRDIKEGVQVDRLVQVFD